MKIKLDNLLYRLIILACLKNKTEEEIKEIDNILGNEKIDWCAVAGQVNNHRLYGYFINGLNNEQKKFMPKEFKAYGNMIVKYQELDFINNIKIINPILKEMEKEGIKYCGLKGIYFNADFYSPSDRRSNDIDLMVLEPYLQKLDVILRKFGFIQSLLPNGELVEATRREKLIQLMNYHDLVPYVGKFNETTIRIDINFKFDSKENNIDEEIYNYGVNKYSNFLYSIMGLSFDTNLLFLCIHFFREGTNTLWTEGRRDVVLYKIIDIINFIRMHYNEFDVAKWCDLVKKFNLSKKCYYTFYILNEFISDEKFEMVLKILDVSDLKYINEVKVEGSNKIITRDKSFIEDVFDWKY